MMAAMHMGKWTDSIQEMEARKTEVILMVWVYPSGLMTRITLDSLFPTDIWNTLKSSSKG